ncbi:MAG TPA: OmpA family protein [Polyangiaceae bacterium]
MKAKIVIPAALVAIAAASSGNAFAQQEEVDTTYIRHFVPPPRKAFELTLGTGYTEGFGQLTQSVGMPSVAQEGMALDLGLGYRIDPHWMIGAMGEYNELTAERADSARGVVAGIQAAYHMAPAQRVDPWVSLGSGYRWLWEVNHETNTSLLTQGLQMARVLVGVDVRTSREFAIGPVIGADLDEFLAQGNGGIGNPGVSTFVHAGLMGRFDLGGQYDHGITTAHRADVVEVGVTERQPPSVLPPPPPAIVYLSPSVSVSGDILSTCQLKLGNASEFGFDDAQLTDADRNALDAISNCFTSGPLQGQNMRIVGRTDPRGDAQYNMELGQRRAQAVAGYLTLRGVEGNRIEEVSRGALDATGIDEAGWANDRRVDITIAR